VDESSVFTPRIQTPIQNAYHNFNGTSGTSVSCSFYYSADTLGQFDYCVDYAFEVG